MLNLDMFIFEKVNSFCLKMGTLFGMGAEQGFYMSLIFIGTFLYYFMLGGKRRGH